MGSALDTLPLGHHSVGPQYHGVSQCIRYSTVSEQITQSLRGRDDRDSVTIQTSQTTLNLRISIVAIVIIITVITMKY